MQLRSFFNAILVSLSNKFVFLTSILDNILRFNNVNPISISSCDVELESVMKLVIMCSVGGETGQ